MFSSKEKYPHVSSEDGSTALKEIKTRMGLNDIKADVAVLRSILEKEFQVAPDNIVSMLTDELFAEELEGNMDLIGMCNQIENAILVKHPALMDAAYYVLKANLIRSDYSAEELQKISWCVHYTYVLNKLSNTMGRDVDFFSSFKHHLFEARHERGIPTAACASCLVLSVTGKSPFYGLKTETMDYIQNMNEVTRRNRKHLSKAEVQKRKMLIWSNISEAMGDDFFKGHLKNASIGRILERDSPRDVRIDEETSIIKYDFKDRGRKWNDLYVAWNLAFIMENLPYLDILIPKLLIPCVLDCEDEDFLHFRSLSLWVSINVFLYRLFDKLPSCTVPNGIKIANIIAGKKERKIERKKSKELTF